MTKIQIISLEKVQRMHMIKVMKQINTRQVEKSINLLTTKVHL